MITNFQYVANPQVNIGLETWINVSSKTVIDLTFKLKRDEIDLFTIRETADGDVLLYDTDFTNLLSYCIKREPIKCRFNKYDCNTKVTTQYKGYLTFTNEIDYNVKKITANVLIVDKYSPIYEGILYDKYNFFFKNINIFTKNIDNIVASIYKSNLKLYLIEPPYTLSTDYAQIQVLTEKLLQTITFDVYTVISNILYNNDLDISTIAVMPRKHLRKFTDDFKNVKYNFSFYDIISILRENLGLYFYVYSGAKQVVFVQLSELIKAVLNNSFALVDLSNYQINSEKKIEVFEPEFNSVTFESFVNNLSENQYYNSSEYFKTFELNFANQSEGKKSVKTNSWFDPYQTANTEEITLMANSHGTNVENWNLFTKQFDIATLLEGQAVSGNWDLLQFTNKNTTSNRLYIYTKNLYHSLNENMYVSFRLFYGTLSGTTKIQLTWSYEGSPSTRYLFYSVPYNTSPIDVNQLIPVPSTYKGNINVWIEVIPDSTISYTIINFNIRGDKFVKINKPTGKVSNYKLSPFNVLYDKDYIMGMPNAVDNQGRARNQKETFECEMTIKDFNYGEGYFINNYFKNQLSDKMLLYEVSQNHTNNSQSYYKIKLRGK